MKKVKIGAITIGQAPRVDITADIGDVLGPNIELIERGAVDNFTYEEICNQFAPTPNCITLVSRMKDGKEVILSKQKILPLMQQCINELEQVGCDAIVLLCTSHFPDFKSTVPLIVPYKILDRLVIELVGKGNIGIISPSRQQVAKLEEEWKNYGLTPYVVDASPYDITNSIAEVAKKFDDKDTKIIYLNCMGYSVEMKQIIKDATNKSVILPRTIIARVISEMFL